MLGGSTGEKQSGAQTANVLPLSSTVAPAISSDDLVEAKRLAPYVGALQGGLRVEPVRENRAGYNKETRLIDISYQHGDPEVAAKIKRTLSGVVFNPSQVQPVIDVMARYKMLPSAFDAREMFPK